MKLKRHSKLLCMIFSTFAHNFRFVGTSLNTKQTEKIRSEGIIPI